MPPADAGATTGLGPRCCRSVHAQNLYSGDPGALDRPGFRSCGARPNDRAYAGHARRGFLQSRTAEKPGFMWS